MELIYLPSELNSCEFIVNSRRSFKDLANVKRIFVSAYNQTSTEITQYIDQLSYGKMPNYDESKMNAMKKGSIGIKFIIIWLQIMP